MPRKKPLPLASIRSDLNAGRSLRDLAKLHNCSPSTIARVKAQASVRRASEFRGALTVTSPTKKGEKLSWDLEQIRAARDAQMLGQFALPARLSAAMATDDAIFVARRYRVAPHSALGVDLQAAPGVRGSRVRDKAANEVIVSREVLTNIAVDLADLGVGVGINRRRLSADGSRITFELEHWPMEFVRYDRSLDVLTTETANMQRVPITHGDGNWVVFSKYVDRPWTREACVLPAGFLWSAHAEGLQDWNMSSRSHGLSKIIGQLPEGVALLDEDGNLPVETEAFLEVLARLVSGLDAAGVIPAGSKADFISDNSTAYQVFKELVDNRERNAARVYLGTSAYLGSSNDAPGVDISKLFSVASTILQTDLSTIERGLHSGVYVPWTAINYGDSSLAPKWKYLAPDPDAEQRSAQDDQRSVRLFDAIDRHKKAGMRVDQKLVDELAKKHGVSPVPQLLEAPATAPDTEAPSAPEPDTEGGDPAADV